MDKQLVVLLVKIAENVVIEQRSRWKIKGEAISEYTILQVQHLNFQINMASEHLQQSQCSNTVITIIMIFIRKNNQKSFNNFLYI